MSMYHAGNRVLQEQFNSTALADRISEKFVHSIFSANDKAFIEGVNFFFLATASPDGQPDCSFKGGAPGFVKVMAPDLLIFPDFDGNGMFKSLGNIAANPQVGLLFIAMDSAPTRLRINGRARVSFEDPLMGEFTGAQALIRVTPEYIFPNCPRYIPNLQTGDASIYAPLPGVSPVEPEWKNYADIKDVVPPRKA